MLNCPVPVLHIEADPRPKRVDGGIGEVRGISAVVLVAQQGVREPELFEYESVAVLERSPFHGFVIEETGAQHDPKFPVGSLRFVSLAVKFHQFAVCKGPGAVHLTRKIVEILYFLVVRERSLEPVHAVEKVVAAADYGVKCGIDGLHLRVGRENFPLPNIAVGVGVALHGIYQVALDVGAEGEVAAVE